MSDIVDALFAFPTGIPSVLLLIALAYWLIAILGGLDHEMFDIDFHPDLHGDVHLDVHSDVHGELHPGLGSLFSALGLGTVPLTVVLSLEVWFTWLLTAMGRELIPGTGAVLLGSLLLTGSVLGALPLTIACVKPLRPLFAARKGRSRRSLIGKVCTVSTLRVDPEFGQARYEEGAEDMVLQVRSAAHNRLSKGSKVLIVGEQKDREAFDVIPHDESTPIERRDP